MIRSRLVIFFLITGLPFSKKQKPVHFSKKNVFVLFCFVFFFSVCLFVCLFVSLKRTDQGQS